MTKPLPQTLKWHRITVQGQPGTVGEIAWGDKVTVAFIHGFASSPLYADRRAIESLANSEGMRAAGARILAPILPGFGATPPLRRSRHSLDDYADWYLECLNVMKATGPIVLFGESMGGAISTITAAKQAADVRALLVFNSVGGKTTHRHRWQWLQALVGMTRPQRGSSQQWVASAVDAALTASRARAAWHVAHELMKADLRPTFRKIKKIGIPTVAVFSKDDPLIVPQSSETFRQSLDITPLYIPGDHRSFISRHPAVCLLIDELVTAVANDEVLARNPAERLGADVLEANGISTLMETTRGRLQRPVGRRRWGGRRAARGPA